MKGGRRPSGTEVCLTPRAGAPSSPRRGGEGGGGVSSAKLITKTGGRVAAFNFLASGCCEIRPPSPISAPAASHSRLFTCSFSTNTQTGRDLQAHRGGGGVGGGVQVTWDGLSPSRSPNSVVFPQRLFWKGNKTSSRCFCLTELDPPPTAPPPPTPSYLDRPGAEPQGLLNYLQ